MYSLLDFKITVFGLETSFTMTKIFSVALFYND